MDKTLAFTIRLHLKTFQHKNEGITINSSQDKEPPCRYNVSLRFFFAMGTWRDEKPPDTNPLKKTHNRHMEQRPSDETALVVESLVITPMATSLL